MSRLYDGFKNQAAEATSWYLQIAGQGDRVLQEHEAGEREAQPADRKRAGLLAYPAGTQAIRLQCGRYEQVRHRRGRDDETLCGTKGLFDRN